MIIIFHWLFVKIHANRNVPLSRIAHKEKLLSVMSFKTQLLDAIHKDNMDWTQSQQYLFSMPTITKELKELRTKMSTTLPDILDLISNTSTKVNHLKEEIPGKGVFNGPGLECFQSIGSD